MGRTLPTLVDLTRQPLERRHTHETVALGRLHAEVLHDYLRSRLGSRPPVRRPSQRAIRTERD